MSSRAMGVSVAALFATLAPSLLTAQQSTPAPAGAHRTRAPISIGNYPNVTGLRLNFRDRNLEQVTGANVTIWNPHEPATGTVTGLALGLPNTGAGDIHGLAVGALGVSASGMLRGISLGGVGVGSGGGVRGIAVGGIGVGSGGPVTGIAIGGIGVGGGGDMRGLMIGGIGAGGGGSLRGISIGGIGVGVGGSVSGLSIGGIGVGAGGSVRGISIGGVGAGAGGDVVGLTIAGVGVGAGGTLRGVAVAGVGVGASQLVGAAIAPMVGTQRGHALVLAPLMFRVEKGGSFRGGSLSAVNYIRGSQQGLSIGLVNYARSLHGVQVGVINIIADRASHRVLPVVNW